MTVYNKNLSSQCNLTAEIEPVQDKKKYKKYLPIVAHDGVDGCSVDWGSNVGWRRAILTRNWTPSIIAPFT